MRQRKVFELHLFFYVLSDIDFRTNRVLSCTHYHLALNNIKLGPIYGYILPLVLTQYAAVYLTSVYLTEV